MLWHAMRTRDGKQMVYLRALHERYGDVVRIGESTIALCVASLKSELPYTVLTIPFLPAIAFRTEPPLDPRCFVGRSDPRPVRFT